MATKTTMELCLALMQADTEAQVIDLLTGVGYWDDTKAWRPYGDNESNFSIIGNQQARSDAALVEKVVNAVDARLLNECLVRGIDPESPKAPRSIQAAVAQFFDSEVGPESRAAGRLEEWSESKRTDIARGITIAATGFGPKEGNPCFSIADVGEGQEPDRFSATFLSLPEKSNKLRVPFVQGKFNMGGTGALSFCGRHNLQLIVSRRNPAIATARKHTASGEWGFTVVRREDPEGLAKSSCYTYLAPVSASETPKRGRVLRFAADKLAILPDGTKPYERAAEWGTLIKLYEYAASGYSNTMILRRDGLLSRLDLLLPEIGLPVRLHECRPIYRGKEGSFETTLAGLSVRIDDEAKNSEPGFPTSSPMSAGGERMNVRLYAFKQGTADTYRKNEGIIFTINGQTHGHLGAEFFTRKSVGLSYLADSLLVVVDCSEISGRGREDLFMGSRDRLRKPPLYYEIDEALVELLKQHDGLRSLKDRRRREELESKLGDEKPLEDVLESLLKQYPTLSTLFLKGQRASNPFRTDKGGGEPPVYKGKRHPTYFRFKGKETGATLSRECHINRRCRIAFETDAVNDYFSRKIDKGTHELELVAAGRRAPVSSFVGPNLQDGTATLSIRLPANCDVGDTLTLVSTVSDPSRVEPFVNTMVVKVRPAAETGPGGKKKKRGNKPREGELPAPAGIALPNIRRVREPDWNAYKPAFNRLTALRVVHAGAEGEGDGRGGADVFDFFVNVDNLYLKTELKAKSANAEILSARFVYGLVLIGLGMIQDDSRLNGQDAGAPGPEDENGVEPLAPRIEKATTAIAPVLLPMIEALSGLDPDEITSAGNAGEET